ncbi:hypothetical protein OIO90_002041 [Microbotryomycetes sp. JL221]|nr:hypothetical protein OIO90_002041 [Microbotryomycetes sp. JL221]
MLLATLIASFAPLYLDLSPKRVAQVSTYSTGLLLGAALTVVIPEGVAAVFGNSDTHGEGSDGDHGYHEQHGHDAHDNAKWIGLALLAGFIVMYIIDSTHKHDPPSHGPSPHSSKKRKSRATLYRTPSQQSELEPLSSSTNAAVNGASYPSTNDYGWEEQQSYHPHQHHHQHHVGNGNGNGNGVTRPLLSRSVTSASSSASSVTSSIALERQTQALSTVIGLLVHSIADGISLGASSMSSSSSSSQSALTGVSSTATSLDDDVSLDLIIFLAIMVHKAPAAFALSSLLRTSYVSSFFRYRSLLLFSLAAPFGAVLTFLFLYIVGADDPNQIGWWTGIALVFSGGTFLFVATHVMNHSHSNHGDQDQDDDDEQQLGHHHHHHHEPTGRRKVALVILGMLTPFVLTQLIGHHGH